MSRPTDSRRISSKTPLPYNSHPNYPNRKALLLSASIGAALNVLTLLFSPYGSGFSALAVLSLAISGFFALLDLQLYAMKKAQDPEHDPAWPTVGWIVGDGVLAVVLLLVFCGAVGDIGVGYNCYGSPVVDAYAALPSLVNSVLHASSFRKQLVARCKNKWLASLPKDRCTRCGSLDDVDDHLHTDERRPNAVPPNLATYVGPSADFARANVLTPQSPESSMEEGLLIGSEFMSGYGSIGSREEEEEVVVEQPAETIVGSSRKKRVAGHAGKRAKA